MRGEEEVLDFEDAFEKKKMGKEKASCSLSCFSLSSRVEKWKREKAASASASRDTEGRAMPFSRN